MGSTRLRLLALGFLGAVVCAGHAGAQPKPAEGTPSELSDSAKLSRATTLYDAGKYGECVKELASLLGAPPKLSEPEVVEKARIYYAACLIANGQVPVAEEQMRAAIRANPTMRPPDSLVFPQPVVDRFIRVRDALMDEIKRAEAEQLKKKREEAEAAARRAAKERARVERLELLASQEVVVTQNSRWLAAVPFGVGQFQNREPVLGWIFLGTEAALAGTALTSMVMELRLNSRINDNPPPDPTDLNSKLRSWHQVLVVSSWGFLGTAAIGAAQAEISFVPEYRELHKKELPSELQRPAENGSGEVSFRPAALPLPGGVALGVLGVF